MQGQGQTFDKEKPKMSIARLKSHGGDFEVVIDPENAIKFRHGEADIHDALKAPHIYSDAGKGERASEQIMQGIFNTSDESKIAEKIIKEGEINLDDEYRDRLRSEKKEAIIAIIIRDAVEANTGNALTAKRLQAAFTQGRINVDLFKKPEEQVADIVQKLRTVLSLSIERKILQIRIPSDNAAKLYGLVTSKATIIDESWLSDGAWSCRAELPAGLAPGLIDELKSKTHGHIEISVEAKKETKKK